MILASQNDQMGTHRPRLGKPRRGGSDALAPVRLNSVGEQGFTRARFSLPPETLTNWRGFGPVLFQFANRTPSPPGVRRGRVKRYPFIGRSPADQFLDQPRRQALADLSKVVIQSTSPSPLKLARDGIDEVQKFTGFGAAHDH